MLQSTGIDPTWYDMNKDGQMGQFELDMARMVMQVLELFDSAGNGGDHKVSAQEYGDSQKQRKWSVLIKELEAGVQAGAQDFQIAPKIF